MTDEKKLIEMAISGNERAFSKLIRKYDRKILNLLLNILKNEADASDAYQDTFIKVHRYLPKFKQDSSFYTWLYRIAINTAYTFHQKRKSVTGVFLAEDFSTMEHIFNSGDSAEEIADIGERSRESIVKEQVDKLSFQQKSVVYLKSYEGKKFKEIAEILSLNIGTVKKYFHRAVQNIKKSIIEEDD